MCLSNWEKLTKLSDCMNLPSNLGPTHPKFGSIWTKKLPQSRAATPWIRANFPMVKLMVLSAILLASCSSLRHAHRPRPVKIESCTQLYQSIQTRDKFFTAMHGKALMHFDG